MSNAYWQKRDNAKKYIAVALRDLMMKRYGGLPVIVLRNATDKIKAENKLWIKDTLKMFDCEEFNVSWSISFEYKLDASGTAIVSDFTVTVDGN